MSSIDVDGELRDLLADARFSDEPGADGILGGNMEPKYFDALLNILEAWADRRTVVVLRRLHRTNGPGLPKRDFDNVTDEAIDAELDALSLKAEQNES